MRARHILVLPLVVALALGAPAVAAPPLERAHEAGLHRSESTRLDWSPCTTRKLAGFECATLVVPRDWQDPARGTFALAVARHRSSGPASARIGSLFLNPGGPGGSGQGVLPDAWKLLPKAITARFDIVTWDPRGVGASDPVVDCPAAEWELPPAVGPVDWDATAASVRGTVAGVNADCLARHRDVAPFVGTVDVVRDLDALRAAVGDRQLTYWGASYGTRIGYVYALTYPDRVRAVLLDAPVSPRGSVEQLSLGYSTAADTALGILFEVHPESRSHYRRSMATLQERPLRLTATRVLTRWDIGMTLEALIPAQASLPGLARYLSAVDRALHGTPAQQRRAKAYLRTLPESSASALTGLPAFVNCLDYADRLDAARQDALAAQARDEAPITGWYRALQFLPGCDGLEGLDPNPVPQVRGNDWQARLLILGATRDSQTPYAWATEMGTAFRSSRTVTYVGNQHITYSTVGSQCVDDAATRYLLQRRLPPVDIACGSTAG